MALLLQEKKEFNDFSLLFSGKHVKAVALNIVLYEKVNRLTQNT